MNKLTGAQIIYKSLQYYKIQHVFGYSGGANLPLLNAFFRDDHNKNPITFIKSSNEQCSGHAAEGYTKSIANKKPGVIISTSGPGVTNILTPLQNALNDGTPLIAITGQVPRAAIGTDAFQECPATELTRPATKWNCILDDVNNIPEAMILSHNIAMEPRMGPVHIDAPKDILMGESNLTLEDLYKLLSDKKIYSGIDYNFNNTNTNPNIISGAVEENYNISTIDTIANLIKISQRPVFKIGQGCNDSYKLLRYISNTYKIPVTTTIHGLGVMDENSPLALQMMGMHGSAAANIALQESDLIIGVGTRFDDRTVGDLKQYAPEAHDAYRKGRGGIVHVDNSNEQILKVKKLFKSVNKGIMSIRLDSDEFLQLLNIKLSFKIPHATLKDYILFKQSWLDRINKLNSRYKFKVSNYNRDYSKYSFTVQDVITRINTISDTLDICKSRFTYATGVGNHQMFTAQHITWTHPGKMLTSGSLGTMGVCVPYAIGAKLSNPRDIVICIDGDGSFCMTCSDLQTVAELNIPIKICIMNDGKQQMVKIWQKLFFNGRYVATDNKNPDFVKLGESYGIKSLKCDTVHKLKSVTEEMLKYNDGPILVEYKVTPDICLPLVSPGKSLSDMIINVEDIDTDEMSKKKHHIPS